MPGQPSMDLDIEFARSKVIEEEEGRAPVTAISLTHCDEVLTDTLVLAVIDGQAQFGADAVCAAH